jgi:hypothetical protein
MSSGASPGPVDARPTSGKGGNLRTTKYPRPGRTGHGRPKAAATKRAGAHWPTLTQGRLARRVTSTGGREHQAPRSHRNAICRGDSRHTPAISGHLQPGCAAAVRPVAVVQSSLVSTRMQPFTRNRRKTPRFLPRRWRTVVSLAYLQVTQSRQSLGKSNSMATCGRHKEWRDGKRQAVRDRFDMLQSSCRGLISERREGIHIAGRRGQA